MPETFDDMMVSNGLQTRVVVISVSIIAIGLGAFFGFIITRSMTRPLRKSVEFTHSVACGNLLNHLDIEQKDEVGQLAQSLNSMVSALRKVVSEVRTSADGVASASQELGGRSGQISQGSTEQAASAEEASASVQQMSETIKQSAANAQQTEKIARTSADDAADGGEAVFKTLMAMKDIASKISIIEEIARQTNLLKDVSASSVDIAERAGEMLTRLVPDIRRTAKLVQEISAVSREQAESAEQINSSIQGLNTVIQQNAGTAEEFAATAEELSSQADQLQRAMAFFNMQQEISAQRRELNFRTAA